MTGPEFVAWARELRDMGATEASAGGMAVKFAPTVTPRVAKPPAQEPESVDPKEQRQQEREGILGLMRSHG